MVYHPRSQIPIIILYILSLLVQQSKFTYYFTYISSLNYLDTNIVYLLIIFSLVFPINIKLLFIAIKFFLKSSTFIQIFFFKTLLNSLVVGTVLIHPIMFYMFLTIFLLKTYYSNNYISFFLFKITNYNLIFFLTITMFLGGFWATQSNAWGYFWVNDLVEWVLLFIIINSIVFLHFWLLNSVYYNYFFIQLFILSIIILIRVGFFSTRHNFISFNMSVYTIFFTYFFMINILQFSNVQPKRPYKFILKLGIVLLNLILYFNFFLKVVFFNFFNFFLKKLHLYSKLSYFHYTFFLFFIIWLSPFIFFKISSAWYSSISLKSGLLFSNSFYHYIFLLFNNKVNHILTFVTYTFSFIKYYYVINFQSVFILLLNNYQLIYILIVLLFVFRKIVWI